MPPRGSIEDLSGQKFHRLTFVRFLHRDKNRRSVWLLRCECGNEIERDTNKIKTGNTKSCGCQRSDSSRTRGRESIKTAIAASVTHGRTGTRLHRTWKNMKSRCYNPNVACYHRYGARGITVCAEWRNDAAAFFAWADENGYADNLEIDRIDNDGPYCPSNCRWSTRREQTNNQERNRMITHDERTQSASMWARELSIDVDLIYSRAKAGWREEDLLLPPRARRTS